MPDAPFGAQDRPRPYTMTGSGLAGGSTRNRIDQPTDLPRVSLGRCDRLRANHLVTRAGEQHFGDRRNEEMMRWGGVGLDVGGVEAWRHGRGRVPRWAPTAAAVARALIRRLTAFHRRSAAPIRHHAPNSKPPRLRNHRFSPTAREKTARHDRRDDADGQFDGAITRACHRAPGIGTEADGPERHEPVIGPHHGRTRWGTMIPTKPMGPPAVPSAPRAMRRSRVRSPLWCRSPGRHRQPCWVALSVSTFFTRR